MGETDVSIALSPLSAEAPAISHLLQCSLFQIRIDSLVRQKAEMQCRTIVGATTGGALHAFSAQETFDADSG
jgi:hypothetical protein